MWFSALWAVVVFFFFCVYEFSFFFVVVRWCFGFWCEVFLVFFGVVGFFLGGLGGVLVWVLFGGDVWVFFFGCWFFFFFWLGFGLFGRGGVFFFLVFVVFFFGLFCFGGGGGLRFLLRGLRFFLLCLDVFPRRFLCRGHSILSLCDSLPFFAVTSLMVFMDSFFFFLTASL